YGSTPAASAPGSFPNRPFKVQGPGGALSQGDTGQQLQLQDATMRAQFNKTGASNYHLNLHPNVKPLVTINVPSNQGVLRVSSRGVVFAEISWTWWQAQINNLENSADPTHLAVYLTNNVVNFFLGNPDYCCYQGFHGANATAYGGGSTNSNGNA